jgi:NAD(P)-dependent dehydrogenase (short-subunit alcohol dehydrogenase family)
VASVVVTGSTKGLGLGLVRALRALGSNVVVSGRNASEVERVANEVGGFGRACDVSRYEDVQALWDAARERFGGIDVWVNNAGTSNAQLPFSKLPTRDIDAVVRTNLIGVMNGSHVALRGMLEQPTRGAIYNMEGFGADGARQLGMALYGSTKTAIRYFTRSLADETRDSGVIVGTTSPGIVVTELLTSVYAKGDPELWKSKKWLFNFIADPVDVVAPWLAKQILENRISGAHLAWMTVLKVALRALQPASWRRNLFPE